MPLSSDRLHEIVIELASRPRHEKVRSLISELLVHGLDAKSTELDFERPVPEVHGRIDALLGKTLFEFKSDLRREQNDVENKMPDYLSQREKETGSHFLGIATDGATFIPYEIRGGKLCQFEIFTTSGDHPRELLGWLSALVAIKEDLEPNSEVVQRELGRGSIAWNIAKQKLIEIWDELRSHPDVSLKRDLWAQLIRRVYGATVNEDSLFFQHTYLTIIAKTMAAKVLGVAINDPLALLSGQRFHEVGIGGLVESDFFDWLLTSNKGPDLVRRIAMQAGRFRLEDVQTDVLKGLYESLIDPDQRHILGEYYTPDWLAENICNEAIKEPLKQRVLDPACGSGTFLFHAVRRLLRDAEESGIPVEEAINLACQSIFGIDVHPVAAQIARVTFLLALGQEKLKQRPPSINIPVYMGDSLQWNTHGFLAERDVLVEIPDSQEILEFPFEVTRDPAKFDAIIERMLELSAQDATSDGLKAWLKRTYSLNDATIEVLAHTYAILHKLKKEGRDHIWGFVLGNLVRPIWLSQDTQKVEVLVGNPPWLSYRFMDDDMQRRGRIPKKRSLGWRQSRNSSRFSAYFFVLSVELYLKPGGIIAFVMPYAAMTRKQFAGFLKGIYRSNRGGNQVYASVKFTNAWVLDQVQPLFPVPSCVLVAQSGDTEGPVLPGEVRAGFGILPKRDASPKEAYQSLTWQNMEWPRVTDNEDSSPYLSRFRQGATILPRVLCVIEPISTGLLGQNPLIPVVQSHRSSQEKEPWKSLPQLRDSVEQEFLRSIYLGESIAPFRLLNNLTAVIPWDQKTERLLDSKSAQLNGYLHLARWLSNVEGLWKQHSQDRMTFLERINFYGNLINQFPLPSIRVVYSKAGTLPAAYFYGMKKVSLTTSFIGLKSRHSKKDIIC